ncbi:hypothetical protein CKO15_07030 [Halorhodospira abdelmalekii]|uniref:DUF4160 domain-containing protein n=1 Tax=Halorhodospira abdelmalekii TaxID=421629 RepID=UPI0019067A64|nr:hypothetical protein [Halorhodospira abdelmalekii]
MPTLLNERGYKFFFYANEHPPAHVHVMKAERWAKVEISTVEVVSSSLKRQELRECLELLREHREDFLEAWHDWFSRQRGSL